MKILLDAMGGDNAPDAVIKGAVKAAKEIEADIILIGNEEIINKLSHTPIILSKKMRICNYFSFKEIFLYHSNIVI